MVKDAEQHASEDKKRRELVEARNQAEALIHQSEKNLKEHGDKVTAEDKAQIESDLAALKTAKDGDDAAAIQEKSQALVQSSMKLGEAVYKATQGAEGAAPGAGPNAGPGAGAGPGTGPGAGAGPGGAAGGPGGGATGNTGAGRDGRVVDADFEEVDQKKKGRQA
jgi:molecular chaperone DnaK